MKTNATRAVPSSHHLFTSIWIFCYSYGVPVTLSPGADIWLEIKLDVLPVAPIWSLKNGSSFLLLKEGHDLSSSWASGVRFTLNAAKGSTKYSQTVTVRNVSANVLTFHPIWRGFDLTPGAASGNITSLEVRNATYVKGNNTDTLHFEYIVRPGDRTTSLDYTSKMALKLGLTSALRRLSDRPSTHVNRTLVEPGTCSPFESFGCSLGVRGSLAESSSSSLTIEARSQSEFRPRVVSVRSTKPGANSPYGVGEPIDIVVSFSAPVEVSRNGSAPALRLSTGNYALYGHGSGTQNLTFWYIVGEGDHTDILETFSQGYVNAFDPGKSQLSPLDIYFLGNPVGWIRRLSSDSRTPADLSMPAAGDPGSLTAMQQTKDSRIRICTALCARVERVSSTLAPGTSSGAGSDFTLLVRFDREILINTTKGSPYIDIQLGHHGARGGRRVEQAHFINISDRRDLFFIYTVQEGDPFTYQIAC